MNPRRIVSMASLIGSAGGAVLGAALLMSPAVYGQALPPPPDREDFMAPGVEQTRTTPDITGIPGFFQESQWERTFDVYDQDSNLLGNYGTDVDDQIYGLGFPMYEHSLEVVTDSTGAAPEVGASWDYTWIGAALGIFRFPLYEAFHMTSPTETGSLTELFGLMVHQSLNGPDGIVDYFATPLISSYFSNGPDGLLYELIFFNQFVLPIIDVPAPAAAELAAVGDPGGLADLGALWSDLLALV